MKVIIAGDRTYTDYSEFLSIMRSYLPTMTITEIVSGGAKGADKMGEQYASEYEVPLKVFPANWEQYGKAAGPIRNKQMADYADALIAFIKPGSKGTLDMVTQAARKPLDLIVIYAV